MLGRPYERWYRLAQGLALTFGLSSCADETDASRIPPFSPDFTIRPAFPTGSPPPDGGLDAGVDGSGPAPTPVTVAGELAELFVDAPLGGAPLCEVTTPGGPYCGSTDPFGRYAVQLASSASLVRLHVDVVDHVAALVPLSMGAPGAVTRPVSLVPTLGTYATWLDVLGALPDAATDGGILVSTRGASNVSLASASAGTAAYVGFSGLPEATLSTTDGAGLVLFPDVPSGTHAVSVGGATCLPTSASWSGPSASSFVVPVEAGRVSLVVLDCAP